MLPEIGNAYAVLSNPNKRRQYDLTGGEEPSSPGHSHGGGFDFHRGFEADITPEDLFNMFFGGGFPSCEWAPASRLTPGGHSWRTRVKISVPCLCLQQVPTPSATAGGETAIRQTISRRGQKRGETYVDGLYFNKCLRRCFIGVSTVGNQPLCVRLQGGFSMFIQLMPIVVLILVSLLSQMLVSPPPYSLYSRPYVHDFGCCSLMSAILIQLVEISATANTLPPPGLQGRLWNGRLKTFMWTTTWPETSSPSTRPRRCNRLRKTWRRTTCLTSEITAGRRDRRVSNHGGSNTLPNLGSWILFSFQSCYFSVFSATETDLLYAAKVYRDERMRKKAELMTMDNCKELDRLNSIFRGGWVGCFSQSVTVYE